jgi:hypothetical protein
MLSDTPNSIFLFLFQGFKISTIILVVAEDKYGALVEWRGYFIFSSARTEQ